MFKPMFKLLRSGPKLLCISLLALAPGANASELEPDVTLEGFPFSSPASVAMSADGRDLYAGGQHHQTTSSGLVWLRRDPDSGRLQFRRNYLSSGAQPEVTGSVLSADQQLLYVLTPSRILIQDRESDGSLVPAGEATTLPADFRPERLDLSPLGDRLMVTGGVASGYRQVRIYLTGPGGALTFEQALTGGSFKGPVVFLDNGLAVCSDGLLRRTGGGWSLESIPALAAAQIHGGALTSPDRRYVYVRASFGQYPFDDPQLVAFEKVGSQLVEVGRTHLGFPYLELIETALAIHPQSGDLYVATLSLGFDPKARIHHFRAISGGRAFTPFDDIFDVSHEDQDRTRKESLTFSPDGRHLYATFGGEPMALLAVDPADGSLAYVPAAAGLHSHFERPSKIVPMAPGEAYLLTPRAVLQTRWQDGRLELRSSLVVADGPRSGPPPVTDLALTPGGGAGVLSGPSGLYFIERNPATGELRLLPETRVSLSAVQQLAISPDGRYVYALVENGIVVYFLRRDVPQLVHVQFFGRGGNKLILSPNGTDAVLVDWSRLVSYLSRDIESGELSVSTGPDRYGVQDALFAQGGRLLYLFASTDPSSPDSLEVLLRHNVGLWQSIEVVPQSLGPTARQVADREGHFLYRFERGHLSMFSRTPALQAFEGLATLDPQALGGVGSQQEVSPSHLFTEELRPSLALLPGENELLVVSPFTGNLRLIRRGCGAPAAGACLAGQRFRVEATWRTGLESGPAVALPVGSPDTQLFSFFDLTNWEVMAKVLDGCAINGRFWVYAAASTDLGLDLRVTDTWTGQRRVYSSPAGAPAPAVTDADAFATCGAPSPGWSSPLPDRAVLVETPGQLELGGRFVATVEWRTLQGLAGPGHGLRTVEQQPSGLFYFFDRNNWEMQVKVLDGCAINSHYWVLGAATTDVGYTLEIRDRVSGLSSSYFNPAGHDSPAIVDLEAFTCR